MYVLESDLHGITKHDFEVVVLTGMGGSVGALVLDQYGMSADMEQLAQKVQRRFFGCSWALKTQTTRWPLSASGQP